MQNYTEISNSNNTNDIKTAYQYCCNNFEHQELIDALSSDDDLKKQLCIINLSKIESQEEADFLIHNLTNHAGIIREVTSVKINEFIKNNQFRQYFQTQECLNTFFKAILDVNPTVCRNIIEIIDNLDNQIHLKDLLIQQFFSINKELEEIEGPKTHIISKKIFKLYWCLEALSVLIEQFETDNNFLSIIEIASKYEEYTIREKAAKLLSISSKKTWELDIVRNKLINDDNLFVRRHFL